MKKLRFVTELIGCNLVAFHNEEKNIHVILEYDNEAHRFKAFSDYEMTKYFTYRGRRYDRTKYGNHDIYRKVFIYTYEARNDYTLQILSDNKEQ